MRFTRSYKVGKANRKLDIRKEVPINREKEKEFCERIDRILASIKEAADKEMLVSLHRELEQVLDEFRVMRQSNNQMRPESKD